MNNFERLGLYPHNIESSQKVKRQFDDGAKTVSIIHATGTGKSYNALYLAMEYKDEKIVWLVPSNAIKEHIEKTINDNPNVNMERDFSNLEIRTYQSLINLTKKEIKEIPCSFLITDEFHHLGAPVWGERVKTFIESHSNLKTFGMTAYNVRDRGTVYERDMTNPETEEIFSNTTESVYDLYDAMMDGILPKPITKSVITEESELILEIKEKIEILKRKGDKSYLEYEKMISDAVKIINKQNGVKELIQQSVKPSGKYIYFCPVLNDEGKNDMDSIMQTMKNYLQEKYPTQNIVFYKSTSADGEYGKYNRDCFYNDKDLNGNDARDAIKIIFVKNQYNEGVHAPNIDGVFLGRKTRSDIVAFEQIGRALSVRGNTHEKMIEYSNYDLDSLIKMAIKRGILVKETDTKQHIIEKLISPIIIDLADNINFIQELETNLGERIRENQSKSEGNKRIIKITDSTFDIDIINKDLFKILEQIRTKLNSKTWDDWYELARVYYIHHKNSKIKANFKTINGYEYDEKGYNLGTWCVTQRQNHKKQKLTEERRKKLEEIDFIFETKKIEKRDTQTWDEKYKLLVAYYEKHGNSNVEVSFKTINGYEYDENGYNLGTWCASQRQQQKQGKLSEERRKKLEDIEFRIEVKKIIRLQWNEWYKLLEAYYKEHGNTEIPWGFKTINGYEYDENGVTLGTWCVAQRQKQDKLGESKRRKLEDIKFRFEVKNNDENWEKMYELAKVYYEKYGNTEIPGNFKTVNGYEYDENGVTLGQWCSTQRHNRDNLKDARRKKLEDIEFRFEGNLKDIKWEKMYELAKIYYEKHGNSRIKVSFKTINGYEYDENGVTLGLWIHTQRQEQDRLGNEKKKKLEEIDFLFKINKNTRMPWEEWYSLLKAHYDYHGIPTVPHNFKTINGYEYDENGVTLGYWCHTQRINRNILNEERRIKLEEIGFNFEYNDYQKLKWEKMYKLVKAYYEHFGNLRIPSDFKTLNGYEYNENGEILYDWCEIQRTSQNTLNEDQIKKLEEIEFQFKIKKHWEKRYELLKKYYICHGIPIVPSNFKTINGYEYDENGIALGDWCNRQRVNRDILNEDQIKKLEEIGFNFEYNDYKKLKWEKMYELVKAYYEHFGNLRIPPDFKTLNGYEYNENGEILWDWCIIQKQKKANLSEEQRKKLDDLGFSSIKKETTVERKKEITVERKKEITVERKKETSEERKKILCNVYGINYEKYDFIKKIAYKELYAKIQYLIENNYLVTENGRIHEIFIISNEHMQLEYHISKEELISRYYVNDKKRGK